MHSLYSRHPNGPLKTHTGTRRARPRSVFNVRLFNGNLESFIKVLITSLPAWHCSSSYLFSVLLWLSGHFGGFPQSILALIYLLTNNNNNNKNKQQQHICAKMDFGNLPHESVSSGGLRLWCKGGTDRFGGLQEERRGEEWQLEG